MEPSSQRTGILLHGAGYAKLTPMPCPLCRQRSARRQCPALGRAICAVCCGSKRQVEINCPPDCGYLVAAQAPPAASVRRQQERDLGFVMAMRDGLTATQSDPFLALLSFIAGLHVDPLVKLRDEDVADGSGAYEPFAAPVYWIKGNNENFDAITDGSVHRTADVETLAQLLGMTGRNVQLQVDNNLLVRASRGQYDMLASYVALWKAYKDLQSGQNDKYNHERTEAMQLKRMERELEYYERAGKLVNAEAVGRAIEKAIADLKLVPPDNEFVVVSRSLGICFGDAR